jgi:alpha-glucosidase
MKSGVILIILLTIFNQFLSGKEKKYQLLSPDSKTKIEISIAEKVNISVFVNGKEKVSALGIDLIVEEQKSNKYSVKKVKTDYVNRTLYPVLPLKNSRVKDECNKLVITFSNKKSLEFRSYNNGVAYRFLTSYNNEIIIKDEKVRFKFKNNSPAWYLKEKDAPYTQGEINYSYRNLNAISPDTLEIMPILVAPKNATKILITETDLFDYPGMWLKANSAKGFDAHFFNHVSKIKRETNGVNSIVTRDNFIAKTTGTRSFPWRVIILAERDADLLNNELVTILSRPNQLDDPSWIKSGKMAWDWWNGINVTGVDFKVGINTATYKYFIDFAAEYGMQLIVLDAGWYKIGNIFNLNPNINMEVLSAYAKKKNVGLVLRIIWRDVDDQPEKAFAQFEKWGIAGLKIDQMRRDDQTMVKYYWRVAKQAAKHHILINFHGNYKPSGLSRSFPNVITMEGVKGLEWVKWSDDVTPKHNLTIPFIRMVAGPMDYTPGAMINVSENKFVKMGWKPMSMGTRAHQMAMYVIYESPQSTLADTPVLYRQNKKCTEFIAGVPGVWDETIALDGKIGEYVLMARRKGSQWYIGAMAGKNAHEFDVDVSFLSEGKHKMELFKDGTNANRNASDFKREVITVTNKEKIHINMSKGGGWVAKID